ncbi:polysaccharide biosynthesis/export family protein [Paraglaciecola marina]|uniref:polysaccharide biosynthesis/export family protein n=1 Tax=Paraglaciecola marina TaxID=2500157 RepID=UPI001060F2E3|nr:polysaccharide biosynthesis/export family protein [Paraglaciecola marina]
MKKHLVFSFVTIFLILINSNVIAQQVEDYKLSTDDQVSVIVFNEPDLNLNRVRVSTNGTISMPLIGQVNVSNLTVSEVEKKLIGLLRDGYLKKPDVSVSIVEYRPFYIGGEVQRPGSYPYRKGLTIQKAVTIAGGFTERASESAISIENKEQNKNVPKASFLESVKPGDVITVGESFF